LKLYRGKGGFVHVTRSSPPAGATAAVLTGLIDDAALFPPGNAALPAALREHARRAGGQFAYVAGPFVVPARRLADMVTAQRADASAEMPQRVSVLVDYERLDEAFEQIERALSCESRPQIEAVELRIPSVGDAVSGLLRAFRLLSPLTSAVFVESSQMAMPGEARRLTDAIAALGTKNGFAVGAKVRTGGVERDAVPPSTLVAEFIEAAQCSDVSWKATAGLHHPLRDRYGTQTMHGFLNLLVATAAAYTGDAHGAELVELLESNPDEIELTPAAFVWGERRFETAVVAAVRRDRFRSFGSCSFDEPLDALRALGLLR
jgi:hypothetical protein